MSKQTVKRVLAILTLKSGRRLTVNLGTQVTFNSESFSDRAVVAFDVVVGDSVSRKIILLGSTIESIETYEGEIEIEVVEPPTS
jgi:hypothetical protein